MKSICVGAFYQMLSFFRIRKAVFFSFFFPSFAYIIFSLTWGWRNEVYNIFLFSGMICLTIVSDSLFSTGNVIVEYYHNGLIKFFKCLPYPFFYHLLSLFMSRIIIIFLSMVVLVVVALLSGNISFNQFLFGNYILCMLIGLILFSLLGTIVAMITKDFTGNSTAQNIILFAMLFLSNTFYPISELNPLFTHVVQLNPITPIIQIARGESVVYLTLGIWLVVLSLISIIFFRKQQIKR